jgi:hypothetical protein
MLESTQLYDALENYLKLLTSERANGGNLNLAIPMPDFTNEIGMLPELPEADTGLPIIAGLFNRSNPHRTLI